MHSQKEVSHLRGLVSGSEKQDNDTLAESFPGSPGSLKWEGLYGSSSPLASGKRISRVCALKLEKSYGLYLLITK